jgi:hypothetical protein
MTKDEPSGKQDAKAGREARLAAQLRENLKRRKAQARARKAPGGSDVAGENGRDETGQASQD